MQAHLDDLRVEVRERTGGEREAWLARLGADWRTAELSALDAALCAYAERLTLEPAGVRRADLDALHAHGLDDAALLDVIQVVAFFNYINRVADAVHVDLEPGMTPYPGENGPENQRASPPASGSEARGGGAEL